MSGSDGPSLLASLDERLSATFPCLNDATWWTLLVAGLGLNLIPVFTYFRMNNTLIPIRKGEQDFYNFFLGMPLSKEGEIERHLVIKT